MTEYYFDIKDERVSTFTNGIQRILGYINHITFNDNDALASYRRQLLKENYGCSYYYRIL